MGTSWITGVIFLLSSGVAWAQQPVGAISSSLRPQSFSVATSAPTWTFENPAAPRFDERATDSIAATLWSNAPRDSEWDKAGRLLEGVDNLLAARMHQLLTTNTATRTIGFAVGGALLGYQCAGGAMSSPAGRAGVQLLRWSEVREFQPLGFRVEPSARSGAFAIYLRKTM